MLTEMASIMLLTVLSSVVLSAEPVMLAAMLQAHRLTAVQLGHAATAELLAMAAVTGLAGGKLKPERLKAIAIIAVLITSVANLLTMFTDGNGIVVARLISGAASGIMPWLLISMLVRSEAPARIFGITNVCANITALSLVQLSSRFIIPHFGPSGPYGLMLGFSLLMIIPAMLVPSRFNALPDATPHRVPLSFRAICALLVVIAFRVDSWRTGSISYRIHCRWDTQNLR